LLANDHGYLLPDIIQKSSPDISRIISQEHLVVNPELQNGARQTRLRIADCGFKSKETEVIIQNPGERGPKDFSDFNDLNGLNDMSN